MVALKRLLSLLSLVVAIAALLAGVAVISYHMLYDDLIYAGVRVEGIPLGGLTVTQAQERLARELRSTRPRLVNLRYGDNLASFSLQEMGARLDDRATAEAAFRVGREGGLWHELEAQWKAFRTGWEVAPAIHLEDGKIEEFLARLAQELDRPARPGNLILVGGYPNLISPQKGLSLDRKEALQLISREATHPSGEAITLPARAVEPPPMEMASLNEALSRILQGPLVLLYEEKTWVWEGGKPVLRNSSHRWMLDRAQLADMLVLVPGGAGSASAVALDQEKLKDFLRGIASRIDQPAREARFNLDTRSGQLTPSIASQEGRTLDITRTLALINAQVASPSRTVILPVITEKPRIAMEEAASFGIVELVSKGVTTFAGSPAERVRNIQVASAQFHGVLVRPGETFSFNHYLGQVVDAFGYKQAYVIFGDRTVLGAGGGVCQVSSTAFRAAFWGGFPIVERWAHSYRVSWYEPPVGLDATVFAPDVDLKFQNDTPGHILIQVDVDTKKGVLTFYFYGTKLPRTVEMSGPVIANVVPHGEPIKQEDPSLPEGVEKQVEWEHDGADVTITRVVKEAGKVVSQDRFFSRYRPWPARFLVGPAQKTT